MVNWFAGVIFGIFLLFMAFYRIRPKMSKKFVPSTKIKICSILSNIYGLPNMCSSFLKKWLKFPIFTLRPKVDRNKTRIRTFLKPILKRAKNRNLESFIRLTSAKILKRNNDDENTEKSRSGKYGKIFLNYKN